jgi:hypothetical protein
MIHREDKAARQGIGISCDVKREPGISVTYAPMGGMHWYHLKAVFSELEAQAWYSRFTELPLELNVVIWIPQGRKHESARNFYRHPYQPLSLGRNSFGLNVCGHDWAARGLRFLYC